MEPRFFSHVEKILFKRPLLFIALLSVLITIFLGLQKFSPWLVYPTIIVNVIFVFYIPVSVVLLVRHSLRGLFTATSLLKLFINYAHFIVGVLLLLSFGHQAIEFFGMGYLTHGT